MGGPGTRPGRLRTVLTPRDSAIRGGMPAHMFDLAQTLACIPHTLSWGSHGGGEDGGPRRNRPLVMVLTLRFIHSKT